MVQYKWVALSNTTIGVFMASVNGTIILISLPDIFNGINLNPFQASNFAYLLWVLMGYNIVTATLLVTSGRLSDFYGRAKLFNLGFATFTVGSLLLFLLPSTGTAGAMELIVFRLVQGVGGAFLFSNSAAIITDAFPVEERGKALGLNQIAFLGGSFIGLVIGGLLAPFNWRYIFLVSVPVGALGSIWSLLKLRDLSLKKEKHRIDLPGNLSFAGGLTLILIGVTYGLLGYKGQPMGWSNPLVILALTVGSALLIAFPFIESHVKEPMFHLRLFRNRAFGLGNLAGFLASLARGGVMLMLIILLQGIWLPLHNYSYSSTPFWAGVFMLPMSVGFIVTGPLSGWLSDRFGARWLATLGMIMSGVAFLLLSFIGYQFDYLTFGLVLFLMGCGSGMFTAPNTALIMNAVPPEERGAASGMRATIVNAGQTVSLGLFFTIVIVALSDGLSLSVASSLASAHVPNSLAPVIGGGLGSEPTVALFSAFLGKDPMSVLIQGLAAYDPAQFSGYSSTGWYQTVTSHYWFPNAIAPAFMGALDLTFYMGAVVSFIAAFFSAIKIETGRLKSASAAGSRSKPGIPDDPEK